MGCEPKPGEEERYYVLIFAEGTIYGHTIDAWGRKHYPEDQEGVELSRERGREWGCWHSIFCPDGEIGSQDSSILREISYEKLVEASEAGWPEAAEEPTVPQGQPMSSVGYIDDEGNYVQVWNSLEGDK